MFPIVHYAHLNRVNVLVLFIKFCEVISTVLCTTVDVCAISLLFCSVFKYNIFYVICLLIKCGDSHVVTPVIFFFFFSIITNVCLPFPQRNRYCTEILYTSIQYTIHVQCNGVQTRKKKQNSTSKRWCGSGTIHTFFSIIFGSDPENPFFLQIKFVHLKQLFCSDQDLSVLRRRIRIFVKRNPDFQQTV